MEWKARVIDADELRATQDLSAGGFGIGPVAPPDYVAAETAMAEVDRTFVVDDGDTIVGTGSAYSFQVAFPGGGAVPLAAVSDVAVRATHRRRGVLRALMEALVDQAFEREEPIAGLTASEGLIYRRFGYGVAARFQKITVDPARSAEIIDHHAPGRIRLISEAEAETALPAVWQRHWHRIPGEMARVPAYWANLARDPEVTRGGASARFIAVHDDAEGRPDGFALYRIKHDWQPDGSHHELRLGDLAAADDAVEAALLRFLLEVDLIKTLMWYAPVDMPLRWRLVDPRAVQVHAEVDHLWLRPLDVPACLSARRYAAAGELVLQVVDRARPDLGGRFRLEAAGDGAQCGRTDAEPDLTVAMPDLGAALLGGVPWSTLRRSGLVDEHAAGAVERADVLFFPPRAPYCATDF